MLTCCLAHLEHLPFVFLVQFSVCLSCWWDGSWVGKLDTCVDKLLLYFLFESRPTLCWSYPQPFLQCSKADESQTEIHSRSGTNFICWLFHLNRAIFPFLCCWVSICNFLRSWWHPIAMFYPRPTSPVHYYFLGNMHPLPTLKLPD